MEQNQNLNLTKMSAKDFFLHLGSLFALYVVCGNLINLLFKIINKCYPEISEYNYYWQGGSEISFSVATLIIIFPIFILLSKFIYKSYDNNPEKKNLAIRKWLTYATLFVAGVLLLGDLVAVLYKFLDGQDLTVAFLLKALTMLIVSAFVFGFYLQDIRERISSKNRKIWLFVSSLIIILSIVSGFSILGSPKTQRMIRQDNQKVNDLQSIEWSIINYWQVNGMIPSEMPDMMIDKHLGRPYEYKKTGELNFQLCAMFNLESQKNKYNTDNYYDRMPAMTAKMNDNDWSHNSGKHCFDRKIDPVLYPTQIKG